MTVFKDVLNLLMRYKGQKLHQDRVVELMKQDFRERRMPWKADELNSTTVFRTLRKLAELGRRNRGPVRSDGQGNFWVMMADKETVKLTQFLHA